jgi:hypothetical protein
MVDGESRWSHDTAYDNTLIFSLAIHPHSTILVILTKAMATIALSNDDHVVLTGSHPVTGACTVRNPCHTQNLIRIEDMKLKNDHGTIRGICCTRIEMGLLDREWAAGCCVHVRAYIVAVISKRRHTWI